MRADNRLGAVAAALLAPVFAPLTQLTSLDKYDFFSSYDRAWNDETCALKRRLQWISYILDDNADSVHPAAQHWEWDFRYFWKISVICDRNIVPPIKLPCTRTERSSEWDQRRSTVRMVRPACVCACLWHACDPHATFKMYILTHAGAPSSLAERDEAHSGPKYDSDAALARACLWRECNPKHRLEHLHGRWQTSFQWTSWHARARRAAGPVTVKVPLAACGLLARGRPATVRGTVTAASSHPRIMMMGVRLPLASGRPPPSP
jgi:hypothetical protein